MREEGGTPEAREQTKLVIGPWSHGMFLQYVGELDFGMRSNGMFLDLREDMTKLRLRWFDRWTKGLKTGIDDEPRVKLFVQGMQPLAQRGRLAAGACADRRVVPARGRRARSRQSGPRRAAGRVRLRPGGSVPDGRRRAAACPAPSRGPVNQQRLVDRRDVLTYTSDVLQSEVEVTGPVRAVLNASTSGPDTDWVVSSATSTRTAARSTSATASRALSTATVSTSRSSSSRARSRPMTSTCGRRDRVRGRAPHPRARDVERLSALRPLSENRRVVRRRRANRPAAQRALPRARARVAPGAPGAGLSVTPSSGWKATARPTSGRRIAHPRAMRSRSTRPRANAPRRSWRRSGERSTGRRGRRRGKSSARDRSAAAASATRSCGTSSGPTRRTCAASRRSSARTKRRRWTTNCGGRARRSARRWQPGRAGRSHARGRAAARSGRRATSCGGSPGTPSITSGRSRIGSSERRRARALLRHRRAAQSALAGNHRASCPAQDPQFVRPLRRRPLPVAPNVGWGAANADVACPASPLRYRVGDRATERRRGSTGRCLGPTRTRPPSARSGPAGGRPVVRAWAPRALERPAVEDVHRPLGDDGALGRARLPVVPHTTSPSRRRSFLRLRRDTPARHIDLR